MTERDIVALFFARDERAIAEFDHTLGALCYKIALDLTGDPGTAEECLNDTRLRLWNAIPPEDPVSLKAYAAKIVRRIVRNLALNRLDRERSAKRSAVLEELDEAAELAGASFEEEYIRSAAMKEILESFLAGRTKIEAVVFVRRYFSGESAKEIGRTTGLSPVRISRMLKKLRRDLAADLKKGGIEI